MFFVVLFLSFLSDPGPIIVFSMASSMDGGREEHKNTDSICIINNAKQKKTIPKLGWPNFFGGGLFEAFTLGMAFYAACTANHNNCNLAAFVCDQY